MADPSIVQRFIDAVAIPVISRVRTGHTAEAYVMENIGSDMIEESNNLATADENNFIDKKQFATPFMCTAHDLPTALARIHEGALVIRAHSETGNTEVHELAQIVYEMRQDIRKLQKMNDQEIEEYAESCEVPVDLVRRVVVLGRLPVLYYASGFVSTPADVAFFMEFGCDGVVLNSHVFKSLDPAGRISAMVQAVKCYKDEDKIAKLMEDFELEEKV
ncbi:Pyridoxal 5'-phosphate synthase subunit snz1 [Coemansia asiatica]|nr:Pyridoxal 5'-phosphate synthase subunit snz1 [Coemansia asiatica]